MLFPKKKQQQWKNRVKQTNITRNYQSNEFPRNIFKKKLKKPNYFWAQDINNNLMDIIDKDRRKQMIGAQSTSKNQQQRPQIKKDKRNNPNSGGYMCELNHCNSFVNDGRGIECQQNTFSHAKRKVIDSFEDQLSPYLHNHHHHNLSLDNHNLANQCNNHFIIRGTDFTKSGYHKKVESSPSSDKIDHTSKKILRGQSSFEKGTIWQQLGSDNDSANESKMKQVYIQLKNKKLLAIQFNGDEENILTCGWLLSEAIRRIYSYYLENGESIMDVDSIVGLTSTDKNLALDYYLSQFHKPVFPVKGGSILTPYHANSDYKIEEGIKITLLHFEILIKIGQGGFSQVYLEYCPGGELFYHLEQVQKFSEDDAKVYFGEILIGMEYLHSNKIIFRDLKPENILLDMEGHLKIADFGLSKQKQREDKLNYTFCGSYEYMAPEMFLKKGHSYELDYYTLGVLLYEMVAGFPPFYCSEKSKIMEKVLHKEVKFPHHFSKNLRDIVSKLLIKDPKKRLGSNGGINKIKEHKWCSSIDFQSLMNRQFLAPIQPSLGNLNFDRDCIDNVDKLDSLLEEAAFMEVHHENLQDPNSISINNGNSFNDFMNPPPPLYIEDDYHNNFSSRDGYQNCLSHIQSNYSSHFQNPNNNHSSYFNSNYCHSSHNSSINNLLNHNHFDHSHSNKRGDQDFLDFSFYGYSSTITRNTFFQDEENFFFNNCRQHNMKHKEESDDLPKITFFSENIESLNSPPLNLIKSIESSPTKKKKIFFGPKIKNDSPWICWNNEQDQSRSSFNSREEEGEEEEVENDDELQEIHQIFKQDNHQNKLANHMIFSVGGGNGDVEEKISFKKLIPQMKVMRSLAF